MIALKSRVVRLEHRDPYYGNPLAHLSDQELETRIIEIEDVLFARVEADEVDPKDIPADQWDQIQANVAARRSSVAAR